MKSNQSLNNKHKFQLMYCNYSFKLKYNRYWKMKYIIRINLKSLVVSNKLVIQNHYNKTNSISQIQASFVQFIFIIDFRKYGFVFVSSGSVHYNGK